MLAELKLQDGLDDYYFYFHLKVQRQLPLQLLLKSVLPSDTNNTGNNKYHLNYDERYISKYYQLLKYKSSEGLLLASSV